MEIFHFHVCFFSFRYSILDFRLTLDDDDYGNHLRFVIMEN